MTDLPLPLRFDDDGLVPVVIQSAVNRAVLMVAFMNAEALAATRATGLVHFWSRSRGKLWQKGETSGHVQRVQEIFVNCDRNSLLITIQQIGAVCHDGYPTCYYRRLEGDNSLTVIADREFDPATVYGPGTSAPLTTHPEAAGPQATAPTTGSATPTGGADRPTGLDQDDALRALTYRYLSAFARLRDEDFTAESRTSTLLRDPDANIRTRVADELAELAGALDGSHVHANQVDDIALEAGQVIYWVTIASLHQGVTWDQLRPDVALLTVASDLPATYLPRMLRGDAAQWALLASGEPAAAAHATLALVGQALASVDLHPADLIQQDLDALLARSYLRR